MIFSHYREEKKMAAQPQPPQQPIYPDQLSFALDRLYARLTTYVDARVEAVSVQMRIDRQEAVARDEALLKRIENVEATQKVIIDTQREMIGTIQAITQELREMRQEMRGMQQEMREMRQEMRDGFAAQAERMGELAVRIERLERKNTPPEEE
jgi:hypothetical protein